MKTSMGIDIEKFAKVLCKWTVHQDSSDSPDVIFSQMDASVKEAFRNNARWLATNMGWQEL
jgi:hypothetical protein